MAKDEKLNAALELIVGKNDDVTPKDFVDKNEIITEISTEKPTEEKPKEESKETKKIKKVKKPKTPEAEKSKEEKINLDFKSRGFNTLKEAQNFVKTDYFKGLGKEDQDEYLNWLK